MLCSPHPMMAKFWNRANFVEVPSAMQDFYHHTMAIVPSKIRRGIQIFCGLPACQLSSFSLYLLFRASRLSLTPRLAPKWLWTSNQDIVVIYIDNVECTQHKHRAAALPMRRERNGQSTRGVHTATHARRAYSLTCAACACEPWTHIHITKAGSSVPRPPAVGPRPTSPARRLSAERHPRSTRARGDTTRCQPRLQSGLCLASLNTTTPTVS